MKISLSLINFKVLQILYHNKFDWSEGIDPSKSNINEECGVYHYLLFNHGFKFQNFVSNNAMVWQCCVLILVILLLPLLKMFIIISFSMALANLKQFICLEILYLLILGIYKIHSNIKNRICNFSNSLIKSEKLKVKRF